MVHASRGLLGLLTLFAFAGAGCSDAQPDPAPVVPAPLDPLTNVTELHWGVADELGDTALEIVFDVGEENECELTLGSSTRTESAGPDDLILIEDGSGAGWASSGTGNTASFHAGPVDTRDVVGSGGESGGLTGFQGEFSGLLTLSVVAHGVHEWADNPFLDDAAIGFDMECDSPFNVTSASMGHTLLLVDGSGLDGGVGGNVGFDATVNVGDSATIDIPAPRARAGMGSFGYEAGEVVLEHPAGTETWTLSPLTFSGTTLLEGEPGAYTFRMDRASASFDALWMAAYGLDGPYDLVPGLRDEPVTDSPF